MTGDNQAIAAESDPVAAALADQRVRDRLLAAGCAFLRRRPNSIPETQYVAEAEEIVAKAQLEALKRRSCFDASRDVVAWLVGFVVNVTRDHVKKYARTPPGLSPDAPGLEGLAVDLGRPVADILEDEAFVRDLLAQLDSDDRELIRQKYTDDLTFSEIAAIRGTGASAIRTRHHRLIRRLRRMGGLGGEVQS